MKKSILIAAAFLLVQFSYAQKLSYGVLTGFNAYDIEIKGDLNAGAGYSGLNFGGFVEYQLDTHLGVRGNLLYSMVKEDNYYVLTGDFATDYLFDEVKVNTLQIHGLLKYDVSNEYNKGFYLIGGFRMNNVLKATADGNQIDGFYSKSNFGALLGFGVNIGHHYGIELIPEYSLTNTLESSSNKAKNYGAYLNFTFNIDSFLR